MYCAMAKRFATDVGFEVCNAALQLLWTTCRPTPDRRWEGGAESDAEQAARMRF